MRKKQREKLIDNHIFIDGERIEMELMELIDFIEQKFDNEPKDKRTISYKNWKTDLNYLVLNCNRRVGYVMFNKVK